MGDTKNDEGCDDGDSKASPDSVSRVLDLPFVACLSRGFVLRVNQDAGGEVNDDVNDSEHFWAHPGEPRKAKYSLFFALGAKMCQID